MKKQKLLNSKKIIAIIALMLGIIVSCITIYHFIQSKIVDFDFIGNVDESGEIMTLDFVKVSEDLNKNFKSHLYVTIDYPVDGKNVTSILKDYKTSLKNEEDHQIFHYEIPYSFFEESFSKMMSLSFYFDNDKDWEKTPIINVYVNILYSTKNFDYTISKWYVVRDGSIMHFHPNKQFVQIVNNFDSIEPVDIISEYCKNNKTVDVHYIQKNVKICKTFDELIIYVNKLKERDLTPKEEKDLRRIIMTNCDVTIS